MSPRPKSRIPVLVSWSPCNPVWSKISNALKRLGFRSHNFLAQLLSETSRACTIRVRQSRPRFPEKTSDRTRRRPTTHRHRLPRDCEIRVMDVSGRLTSTSRLSSTNLLTGLLPDCRQRELTLLVVCVSAACQPQAGRWHSCLLHVVKRS